MNISEDELRSRLDDTVVIHPSEIYVGILSRRKMRVKLQLLGLDYKEYKGLLDSTFIISGTLTARKWLEFNEWMKRENGE